MSTEQTKAERRRAEEMQALDRLYQLPDWRIMDRIIDRHLTTAREENETLGLSEQARGYALGKLFAFKLIKQLPARVREQLATDVALSEAKKQSHETGGPDTGQPTEGDSDE